MRMKVVELEELMSKQPPERTLEEALQVFEVFASGSLKDEIYILDDLAGKRVAIAPAAVKEKYRRAVPPAS